MESVKTRIKGNNKGRIEDNDMGSINPGAHNLEWRNIINSPEFSPEIFWAELGTAVAEHGIIRRQRRRAEPRASKTTSQFSGVFNGGFSSPARTAEIG